MFTTVDEKRGLVKTDWASVRARVAKVEPKFAKLVDEISPDKHFPVWLAYYRWGDLKGDTKSPFLPTVAGGLYRLTDSTTPKEVDKHLGYGKTHSPMGMVLEKTFEFFVDRKDEKVTIPSRVYNPGSILSFIRNLGRHHKRVYSPNGVFSIMAGCRSTFMLPNIGSMTQHVHLQSDYNVQAPPAKHLYDHWQVFKEIVRGESCNDSWRSCMLFFSEAWIQHLHRDSAWSALKLYVQDLAWEHFEYERCSVYYDVIYSLIQKQRNLKPNPYLVDTARHLIAIMLGAAPGFSPTYNEESLPTAVLTKAFTESYGMQKYHAQFMQPTTFVFEQDKHLIYYSLQYPSSFGFSPKARKVFSTLFEIRELAHIMKIFMHEFGSTDGICRDTVFRDMANSVSLHYFHNASDPHRVIKQSSTMPQFDARFNVSNQIEGATFAADGPFVRGCIGIRAKTGDDTK